MIADALLNLADIATCVSNDFHTMHLNMYGAEFDMMHKKVLKKYYEQAAEDADSWYEAVGMFGALAPTLNVAAVRTRWESFNGKCDRDIAVATTDKLLNTYCSALLLVFNALNEDQCFLHIGVQNTVQTAIEYWAKELSYFNERRK